MKLIFIPILFLSACASNIPRHVEKDAEGLCKNHGTVVEIIPFNSLYQEASYIYKIKCTDNSIFIWRK